MSTEAAWSGKEAKKAGQKFRREARSIFGEYQHSLMKKLDEVRVAIRPRPRWISVKLWNRLANIFVDLSKLQTPAEVEAPSDYLARKHREAVTLREARMPVGGAEHASEIEDLLAADLSTEGEE